MPTATVEFLAERVPVRPGARALALTQDRLVEKTFLRDLGLKTAPFVGVEDAGALVRAVAELGRPAILKTRRFGYDGKGQSLIREGSNVAAVHRTLGAAPMILEGFVAFEREVSVVAARSLEGEIRRLRPLRERARAAHSGPHPRAGARQSPRRRPRPSASPPPCSRRSTMSACWRSRCSSPATGTAARGSSSMRSRRASTIPATGRSTGAQTSQFEQHIRAIAGWPLGATTRRGRVEMHNLIGEDAEEWRDILAQPDLCLHLYGKLEIRPDRKMGHVTRVFPEAPNHG